MSLISFSRMGADDDIDKVLDNVESRAAAKRGVPAQATTTKTGPAPLPAGDKKKVADVINAIRDKKDLPAEKVLEARTIAVKAGKDGQNTVAYFDTYLASKKIQPSVATTPTPLSPADKQKLLDVMTAIRDKKDVPNEKLNEARAIALLSGKDGQKTVAYFDAYARTKAAPGATPAPAPTPTVAKAGTPAPAPKPQPQQQKVPEGVTPLEWRAYNTGLAMMSSGRVPSGAQFASLAQISQKLSPADMRIPEGVRDPAAWTFYFTTMAALDTQKKPVLADVQRAHDIAIQANHPVIAKGLARGVAILQAEEKKKQEALARATEKPAPAPGPTQPQKEQIPAGVSPPAWASYKGTVSRLQSGQTVPFAAVAASILVAEKAGHTETLSALHETAKKLRPLQPAGKFNVSDAEYKNYANVYQNVGDVDAKFTPAELTAARKIALAFGNTQFAAAVEARLPKAAPPGEEQLARRQMEQVFAAIRAGKRVPPDDIAKAEATARKIGHNKTATFLAYHLNREKTYIASRYKMQVGPATMITDEPAPPPTVATGKPAPTPAPGPTPTKPAPTPQPKPPVVVATAPKPPTAPPSSRDKPKAGPTAVATGPQLPPAPTRTVPPQAPTTPPSPDKVSTASAPPNANDLKTGSAASGAPHGDILAVLAEAKKNRKEAKRLVKLGSAMLNRKLAGDQSVDTEIAALKARAPSDPVAQQTLTGYGAAVAETGAIRREISNVPAAVYPPAGHEAHEPEAVSKVTETPRAQTLAQTSSASNASPAAAAEMALKAKGGDEGAQADIGAMAALLQRGDKGDPNAQTEIAEIRRGSRDGNPEMMKKAAAMAAASAVMATMVASRKAKKHGRGAAGTPTGLPSAPQATVAGPAGAGAGLAIAGVGLAALGLFALSKSGGKGKKAA